MGKAHRRGAQGDPHATHRRKWASCSSRGILTVDPTLLAQPARFRTEVIVHELLHLKIRNHGALFKALLRSYLAEANLENGRGTVGESGAEGPDCPPRAAESCSRRAGRPLRATTGDAQDNCIRPVVLRSLSLWLHSRRSRETSI